MTRATPYRCLVVDDEQLARASLKRLIERSETLELVGEAADGESALALARQVGPDVVFLDIRMPGMSGLEVARELDASTRIIFTTAYDEFAVTAFELQALDYLLKPFGPRRFKRAIDRLGESPAAPVRPEQLAETDDATPLERLFVRDRGRLINIAVSDVCYVEAADDYAELVTGAGRHLISVRMRALESRLDSSRFIRIHRSHIVNLDYVDEAAPCGNGRWEVTMKDGATLTSSRSGAARLREALQRGR